MIPVHTERPIARSTSCIHASTHLHRGGRHGQVMGRAQKTLHGEVFLSGLEHHGANPRLSITILGVH